MPYPNEHACRIRQPGRFVEGSFRRTSREIEGKRVDIIVGKLKSDPDGATVLQAYRYPKGSWTVAQARSHCSGQNGLLFEPATDANAESLERMISQLQKLEP